jgi:glycosyltransferase involved in cell wall biosynthesis
MVRVVYHGRDELSLDEATQITEGSTLRRYGITGKFVLSCGSLLPYRRCEDVIAAFEKYSIEWPGDMQLVIAGSGTDRGYHRTIVNMIAKSPVRKKILQIGQVTRDDMKVLYNSCDACIFATEIEACPNIAIEAMTAGCVIISCDKQPLPEMFSGSSVEYRARDVGDLVSKLRLSLTDPELREKLKTMALSRATYFSWKKCAEETYDAVTRWP